MSTMIFKERELVELCKTDAELIRIAFEHGDDTIGILAVKNSIESFKSMLISKKPNIVAISMDMDYRAYIANLLKCIAQTAPDGAKTTIFKEIIN